MKQRLLNRRQIIELWQKNYFKDVYFDRPCCPDCRDIMSKEILFTQEGFVCANYKCLNNDFFSLLPDNNGYYEIIGKSSK